MNVEDQEAFVRPWLSKSSLLAIGRSYGVLMALGGAYRRIRKHRPMIGVLIRSALLSQIDSTEVENKVWALRSLTSSVMIEEGTISQRTCIQPER